MFLKLICLTALVQGNGLNLVQPYAAFQKYKLFKPSCTWNRLYTHAGGYNPTSCIDLSELAYEAGEQNLRCPLSFIPGCLPAKRLQPHSTHKPVIWVHIHKAAGTTMCAMAVGNDEKTMEPMENCNWNPYDVIWPAPGTQQPTCEFRKQHFAEQHATWDQIEREVNAEDLCPDSFLYGIMLRDPIELASSHFNYEHDYGRGTLVEYKYALQCAEQGGEICIRVKSDWWMFFDNWLTRKLMGKSSVALAPGQVTQEVATKAIERLTRFFNVVTILEREEETLQILKDSFGWTSELEHHNKKPEDIVFTEDEKVRMRRTMKYDFMIYNYMKGLPAHVRGASSSMW